MSTLQRVSSTTFRTEVLDSAIPVLVDFYADWCGPCRMLSPTLERLAAEFSGRVKIAKVDIDREQGLADQYRISSIPTLLVMVNGREVGRANGLVGEGALRQALNELAGTASGYQQVG